MATKVIEQIYCDELSKFGFKSGDEFINWSKQIDLAEKGQVVPGGTYELDLYVADSGKRYVNHVLKVLDVKPTKPVSNPTVTTPQSNRTVTPAQVSTNMSKADWEAKDRRISRQGCIQVAVQVQPTFEAAEQLADKMLEYVNRV